MSRRAAAILWSCLITVVLTGVPALAIAGQSTPPPPPPPPPPPAVFIRDMPVRPAQVNRTPEPVGTGAIFGVVISTATGQAVDGVRLMLSGGGLHGPRQVVTDDDGRFGFAKLPAGEFTLRATKTGYVGVTYGQKEPRPGWPGTPITLADGQQIKDLSFSVPPGGVITGVIFDEKNRPSVATPVRVMRWTMQSGERSLTSAGAATTDDRGIYRVYGLPPGDYLVAAVPRNASTGEFVYSIADAGHAEAMTFSGVVRYETVSSGGQVIVARSTAPEAADPPADGYAPVYYPGTVQLSNAGTMSIRASEERGGVDVRLMRVPMSRVEGVVSIPVGMPITNIQVRLVNIAEQVPGVNTQSARAGADGRFRFTAVPPGQYRIVATGDHRQTNRMPAAAGQPARTVTTTSKLWASSELAVSGTPVPDIVLALAQGFPVSGRVHFEPGGATAIPADLRRVRLTLSPFGQLATASGASSVSVALEPDGRFTFPNVVPGQYRLRSASGVTGWRIKSALAGARDAVDMSIEIGQGTDAANIQVTFTDRSSTLSGTVQNAMGQPTSDHMVILFAAEEQYWTPQSRRIQATRPTTGGRFNFGNLPAGEYRLAAVTDLEPGTWYDPAFLRQLLAASLPVSLADGQTRTQDLKVAR